ncbi:TraB family protein [Euphorbia peplus]|nr:TraB family protein [Euphorbia peplus]
MLDKPQNEEGEKLGVVRGSEFRVASEEAKSYSAKVILGDRPIEITRKRTWAKLPLWHTIKSVCTIPFQEDFQLFVKKYRSELEKEMDNSETLTVVLDKMSKKFPTLMETIVHERDRYMSYGLLKVARKNSSVVAVVGRGHLPGIKKNWKQPIEALQLKEISEMPSRKTARVSAFKLLALLGGVVAGVVFISGNIDLI